MPKTVYQCNLCKKIGDPSDTGTEEEPNLNSHGQWLAVRITTAFAFFPASVAEKDKKEFTGEFEVCSECAPKFIKRHF